MVFGLIPWSRSSASLHSECVVLAGWIASDLTSATLARSENNSRLSMNSCASFAPPLISNVKIDPPPFGKYFLYNACCCGSLEMEGWFTFSTSGWLSKYFTTFNAVSTWRSTRRDNVSSPCKKMNACTGEMVAPVSRSKIARIYVANAAGAQSFAKLTPW